MPFEILPGAKLIAVRVAMSFEQGIHPAAGSAE